VEWCGLYRWKKVALLTVGRANWIERHQEDYYHLNEWVRREVQSDLDWPTSSPALPRRSQIFSNAECGRWLWYSAHNCSSPASFCHPDWGVESPPYFILIVTQFDNGYTEATSYSHVGRFIRTFQSDVTIAKRRSRSKLNLRLLRRESAFSSGVSSIRPGHWLPRDESEEHMIHSDRDWHDLLFVHAWRRQTEGSLQPFDWTDFPRLRLKRWLMLRPGTISGSLSSKLLAFISSAGWISHLNIGLSRYWPRNNGRWSVLCRGNNSTLRGWTYGDSIISSWWLYLTVTDSTVSIEIT